VKDNDQGILLHKINFSESSLIVSLYCRKLGMRKFLFQGAKKKQGNILVPLSLVEFDYYGRTDSQLAKISSCAPEIVLNQLTSSPYKRAVAFFLSELLHRTLKEDQPNEEAFFLFLAAEIHELEFAPFQANYPLWFLLEFMRWQGIEPHWMTQPVRFFYFTEGQLTSSPIGFQHADAEGEHVELINALAGMSKDKCLAHPLNGQTRNQLIRLLLRYYNTHFPGLGFPKSLDVLEETFRE
jgi:DNA repair protein RecO (recombination protein O)